MRALISASVIRRTLEPDGTFDAKQELKDVAKDVERALLEIAVEHDARSTEEAVNFVDGLKKERIKKQIYRNRELALADVADYAAEHFATEEAVMRAYEYPFRELHAQEHRKLASMIARFRDQEAAGDPAASLSVLRGMREWISGHLQVTDRPCTEFLNARGFR